MPLVSSAVRTVFPPIFLSAGRAGSAQPLLGRPIERNYIVPTFLNGISHDEGDERRSASFGEKVGKFPFLRIQTRPTPSGGSRSADAGPGVRLHLFTGCSILFLLLDTGAQAHAVTGCAVGIQGLINLDSGESRRLRPGAARESRAARSAVGSVARSGQRSSPAQRSRQCRRRAYAAGPVLRRPCRSTYVRPRQRQPLPSGPLWSSSPRNSIRENPKRNQRPPPPVGRRRRRRRGSPVIPPA